MTHSLADFTLQDMIILGAWLRSFDLEPRSMEEVAQKVVRLLYQEFLDADSGEPTCVVVRFYVTSSYGRLPEALRTAARNHAIDVPWQDDVPCLVLLASAGQASGPDACPAAGGRVLPLHSPDAIREEPVLLQLLRQLGFDRSSAGEPWPDPLRYDPREPCRVLHVAFTRDSSTVPDQDFVRDLGVESVLAMAGALPGGRAFATVLYFKVPVPAPMVHMFKSLALNVKMPLLHFPDGPVFSQEAHPASLPVASPEVTAPASSQVRIVALQQLLESYEQTVVDQGFSLQATVEKLRESEVRFRSLFESSVIGVAIAVRGVIREANETFLRWLEYEREDLPLSWGTVLAPECLDSYDSSVREAMTTGSAPPCEACYLKKPGGGRSVLESRVLLDRGQESVVTLVLDLTARKSLEADVRQAQKLEAVGRLAAGVAHEVNTPIQYVGLNLGFLRDAFGDLDSLIRTYQEVIRQGDLAPGTRVRVTRAEEQVDLAYLQGEVPRAIQQGLEGADRVANIVRAMKEFSHPGTPDKTPVDLNHALQSTVEVSRNEWKYVAQVVTDLDPDLPLVPCLQAEMNQVFLNLVVNAADAISAFPGRAPDVKGTITLRSRRAGDFAEIAIGDTGTGIEEAIRQKVFEPFFTTKEVGQGTGQGLALARSIVVDRHRGTLTLESKVGVGTTFTIRLPLEAGR